MAREGDREDDEGDITWTFFGFETLARGRPVQEWYDALPGEARDEAQDTIVYLQKLPLRLWALPEYEPLGEGLSEIRFKVNSLNLIYRIYGSFGPKGQRYSYTFLLGSGKKTKNDRHSKTEAAKRMSKLNNREATVHVFRF